MLRTFTNSWISAIESCSFGTGTFYLVACFEACNLKQFKCVCPAPPRKWQSHWGLFCFLLPGWLGFLGFDSLRSTLILLVARVSSLGTLTSRIEIDVAGTKLGRWTI